MSQTEGNGKGPYKRACTGLAVRRKPAQDGDVLLFLDGWVEEKNILGLWEVDTEIGYMVIRWI